MTLPSRPLNRRRLALMALLLVVGAACSSPPASQGVPSGMATVPVTLPDGTVIRAELALTAEQQARGLMFRDDLAADAGMLFVSLDEQPRSFWMFHTLIPLDIIWMDSNRRIVEISQNTPPCRSERRDDCPSYGGSALSQYVLELAAGQAAAHHLKVGDQLRF